MNLISMSTCSLMSDGEAEQTYHLEILSCFHEKFTVFNGISTKKAPTGLEFHFLAGSGVQLVWVNGVQNSCVRVPPVKCHGNSNYMGEWKIYVAYT